MLHDGSDPPLRRLVDSRDVLDPNGRTRRALDARVLGHFRRAGPNAWDPYQLVEEAAGPIRVLPGIMIQVEEEGAVFRVRQQGQVVRVAWDPSPEELAELERRRQQPREMLLAEYVEDYASPPALGLAAVIAQKLLRKDRAGDE
jgi:hypothetical protein